jgi:cyclic pyranopterin phosphate synthase
LADEIAEVLQVAATFEIRSGKFTGGETLLRQDLFEIVESVPRGMEPSLTTNGTLLADQTSTLKDADFWRVDVSLNSLNSETCKKISAIRIY